jgi:hypothetical protein
MDKTSQFVLTKDTRISEILERYGDIAEVMEIFGVQRVGTFSIRRVLGRILTVERAAKVHRVPLDQFLAILGEAIARVEARQRGGEE